MRFFSLPFLLIFFSLTLALHGEPIEKEQGTLIVTYQTNSEGERLNLIRFWLINSKNEKTLYPQKDEAVSSHCSANERKVVISSLPIGHYKVEFLIPNKDHFFEDVRPREIALAANQIVKVDQIIPVRSPSYSKETLDLAQLTLNPLYHPLQPSRSIYPPRFFPFFRPWAPPLQSRPINSATFSLKSNKEAGWRLMLRGQIIYSGVGSISNLYIPPGRQYYLLTEDIPGYSVHTAPRSPFDLFPNQIMTMEVFYQLQIHPPLYLEERVFHFPPSRPATPVVPPVSQKQPTKTPPPSKGKLRVITDSSQAFFTLKTETETIIGQGQGYHYLFEDLTPGYYLLDFSNADTRLMPFSARQQIEILPNQTKEVKMQYQKVKRPRFLPSQPNLPINQRSTTRQTEREAPPLVQETLLEVPDGPTTVDGQGNLPRFYIGMHEVTNAHNMPIGLTKP